MGAKLRSITNPIRWSLLLKPLAAAAAWLFLSGWAFAVVVLYAYFVPLFRTGPLTAPFSIFLALAFLVPPNVFYAAFGAAIFALILAIKDLVIVRRREAYELLVFLLSFAGSLFLYGRFSAWSTPETFLALAVAAGLWFWLVAAAPGQTDAAMEQAGPAPPRGQMPLILAALVLFEAGAVVFFLPLSFFAKAALLFFASAVLYEAALNSVARQARQMFVWAAAYAVVTFITIFLADWTV